ncbi:MAG: HAD hydrolase family protein [Pseudomonadota bacterium]
MSTPTLANADTALRKRAANIRLAVFDVDGVLTDGRFLLDANGNELKSFNTQDGFGLRQLITSDIAVAIITGRSSGAVTHRTAELGIEHVFQGCRHKRETIDNLIESLALDESAVAAVGDDIPDLHMFAAAQGLRIAVANAVEPVKQAADVQTERSGGGGAVREIADFLLACRGTHQP